MNLDDCILSRTSNVSFPHRPLCRSLRRLSPAAHWPEVPHEELGCWSLGKSCTEAGPSLHPGESPKWIVVSSHSPPFQTYAASLVADFAQKREVDLATPIKDLRLEEQSVLQMARSIRSRSRGSPTLEQFHETAYAVLDSLDALEEPARVLAIRQVSHVSGLQQIRRTVLRAAFRTFVEHREGLPHARTLLERIWRDGREGTVDSDALGMMIRRFRTTEEGLAWRLPNDTTHAQAFHDFLAQVLTHLTELKQDVFTLIMDIHIDNHMPVDSLQQLIDKCMRLSHPFDGRWTPAAYHVLIQAHRRDGNVGACIKVYETFRSMIHSTASDVPWHQYISATITWPYEALLTASLESRATITRNRYRAPADMPKRIWTDLQADGITPPPRLLAYLIKSARYNKDLSSAHRLWSIFSPSATPTSTPTSPKPDIDCYYQYIKLLRLQPLAKGPIIPLRPLITSLLLSKTTAGQRVPYIRSLWTQVLLTALSPPYHDFPLALWVLHRFHPNGIPLDTGVIDTAASGILKYASAKHRGSAWTRTVLGDAFATATSRTASGRRFPTGVGERNARSRGPTTRHWDALSHHLASLRGHPGNVVYLPLGEPLARWTSPGAGKPPPSVKTVVTARGNDDSEGEMETLAGLLGALETIVERIITTPQRGATPFPSSSLGGENPSASSAKAVLRDAMEELYRDIGTR